MMMDDAGPKPMKRAVMDHSEHHAKGSKKAARAARKLSKAEAAHAGRKAAMMMDENDSSFTAHGSNMKRKQAFAIASSMIRSGKA